MVSVIVRHTLVQVLTPDEKGRVSAVNGVFTALERTGGLEPGAVAWLFASPAISVVSGGIGTLLVVGVAAMLCRNSAGLAGWTAATPESSET